MNTEAMVLNNPAFLKSREHAARLLADELVSYKNTNAIVVAIPRGGIPVAYHVAKLLHLPLEIVPCKKIGNALGQRSMGSVSIDDATVNENSRYMPQDFVYHQIVMIQRALMVRYESVLKRPHKNSLRNRVVIMVDDVAMSGDTALACLKSIRKQEPEKIVVAIPVTSPMAALQIEQRADELISLVSENASSTSVEYETFPVVTEEEVNSLMKRAFLI